jgi:hypothetical protein
MGKTNILDHPMNPNCDVISKDCKAELKFTDLQGMKQVSPKATVLLALRSLHPVLPKVIPMNFKDPEFGSVSDECYRFETSPGSMTAEVMMHHAIHQ